MKRMIQDDTPKIKRLFSLFAERFSVEFSFSEIAKIFFENDLIDNPRNPYPDYHGTKYQYIVEVLINNQTKPSLLQTIADIVFEQGIIKSRLNTNEIENYMTWIGFTYDNPDIPELTSPKSIYFKLDKNHYDQKMYDFIDKERIDNLQKLTQNKFDLSRLFKICDEINECYKNKLFLSVIFLIRSLLDHIPPIFNMRSFSEVANNYSGPRSFKDLMLHLDNSSRKLADLYIHTQIRKVEPLPNATQVGFAPEIDALLAEIYSILK